MLVYQVLYQGLIIDAIYFYFYVQHRATILSCNVVMDTVLIKAMPVTIDHMTAILTMMKAIAIVSCEIVPSIPFYR